MHIATQFSKIHFGSGVNEDGMSSVVDDTGEFGPEIISSFSPSCLQDGGMSSGVGGDEGGRGGGT